MKQPSLCIESGCRNVRTYRRYCRFHYQRWAIRQAEMADPSRVPYSRQPLDVRFWRKVDKNGPTVYTGIGPCWLWTGPFYPQGYGRMAINGKRFVATHVAWYLANGEWPLMLGLFACHRCDNPPCVRPSHLFLGDYYANMADMDAKGRRAKGPRVRT